ncbi:hypothetical protein F4778DRAFT_344450 [Xylariomycetidae sp. FL2044]|nr:hypothetical protein F4778DRAFT_344450 [Xylariomycetidae sp. FL2044]
MGHPPAYVFVVRHGKRLDAADKQWHLSSPTPYDPPLTYGGWQQSKLVGARIAAILQDQEAEDAAAAAAIAASPATAASPAAAENPMNAEPHASTKPKKKRYRVVLHSSPFLRCVQTSIAIAAGIAANTDVPPTANDYFESQPKPPRSVQTSSFSNPAPTRTRPTITKLSSSAQSPLGAAHHFEKIVLRLDPFLGEWLSPDYFEHITPPPKAALLLATAKAELLRREDYNSYPHFHTRQSPSPSTPSQLWNSSPRHGSPLISSMTPDTAIPSGLENLSSIGSSLPSKNGDSPTQPERGNLSHVTSPSHGHVPGYMSPVPSYALSTSEPIPRGYVAHARDNCVDVDYQWDSTREYPSWGDGGELPEEWAAMHQRFRKGLRRLVEWYSNTENPGEMVTKTCQDSPRTKTTNDTERNGSAVQDHEEEEIADVVVLVSHGAGCNALIGAITQQPVLADVAMSSLTMAQKRSGFDSTHALKEKTALSLEDALTRGRVTMTDIYELKLFANVEHLQGTAATPTSRSRASSNASINNRGRLNTAFTSALKDINFGAAYGGTAGGSRSNSANASLGSMRRASGGPSLTWRPSPLHGSTSSSTGGITVGSGVTHFSTRPYRSGSKGLWAPRHDEEEAPQEPPPMLLNFGQTDDLKPKVEEVEENGNDTIIEEEKSQEENSHETTRPETTKSSIPLTPADEAHDKFDDLSPSQLRAGTGNGGLWGSPRPPSEADRLRDFSSSKRRWTVTEHPG